MITFFFFWEQMYSDIYLRNNIILDFEQCNAL